MLPLLDLPFGAYCAMPGVNWSRLGKMRASPAHYRHATIHQRPPTDEQSTGSAVHTLVLEPASFPERYAVYSGAGTRASKEYKSFADDAVGRTVLKIGEYEAIRAMADAIDQHPAAGPLFCSGWAERSFAWTDPATQLACKGRTDWLCSDGYDERHRVILVDLKTCRSTDPREFGRSAAGYGYHMQLAHYAAGLRVCGVDVAQVLIVAVESSAPYDVCVYEVTDDQLSRATADVAALLARVKKCTDADHWPGRCDVVTPLDLPAWIMGGDDIAVGADILWGAT